MAGGRPVAFRGSGRPAGIPPRARIERAAREVADETYMDCWIQVARDLFDQALAGEPELAESLPKPFLPAGSFGFVASFPETRRGASPSCSTARFWRRRCWARGGPESRVE